MWLTEARFFGRRYAGRLLPRCHWAPSEQKTRSKLRSPGCETGKEKKNRLTADLDIVLFTRYLIWDGAMLRQTEDIGAVW